MATDCFRRAGVAAGNTGHMAERMSESLRDGSPSRMSRLLDKVDPPPTPEAGTGALRGLAFPA
ncbi:MAG: hypothetical protein L0214_06330 [candidate division NC10 bacterium]|nr:hypothetical protein [candidate division NC10 bacterium]